MPNRLYYGDNLDVLRHEIATASVDLVYLDPPFNSQATYNVLFRSPTGEQADAQIEAFEDTWHWNDSAERAFDEVMRGGNTDAAEMLRAMRSFLRENDMMAYLAMMAVRLLELHRVLKPTGSLYLHCDPTASHYLKIIMDAIFEAANFRNDIIWKRAHTVKGNFGQGAKSFDRNTDSLLFYTKSDMSKFFQVFSPYSEKYVQKHYRLVEPKTGRRYQLISMEGPGGAAKGNPQYEVMGVTRYWRYSKAKMAELIGSDLVVQPSPGAVPRRKLYLDAGKGVPLQSLWEDLPELNSQAQERLSYPTQKPVALLERVIQASSGPGDTVLDPFCGCGTTIHAAQKLGRQWVGIDVTHLAISLIEKRLADSFPGIVFEVHGTPKDLASARDLARRDKYQFQWWAVSLVNAQPYGGRKKGADSGIDGLIYFKPNARVSEKVVVSVKGGENVSVSMVRDLAHVVERERAALGLFITLAEPTAPMRTEAIKTGFFEAEAPPGFAPWRIPKIQIMTIKDLLAGAKPDIPLVDLTSAFRRAQPVDDSRSRQGSFL